MKLEVKKISQGPVLAKKGDVGVGSTGGYVGPTVGTSNSNNGQVGAGYNPGTGAGGVGYSCSN